MLRRSSTGILPGMAGCQAGWPCGGDERHGRAVDPRIHRALALSA